MSECWKDDDGFHLMAIVEIESIYIFYASNPFNTLMLDQLQWLVNPLENREAEECKIDIVDSN